MDTEFEDFIRWTGDGLEFFIPDRTYVFSEWKRRKTMNGEPDLSKSFIKNTEKSLRLYYSRHANEDGSMEKRLGMKYGYYFTNEKDICKYLGISSVQLKERISEVASRHQYPKTNSRPNTPLPSESTSIHDLQSTSSHYEATDFVAASTSNAQNFWNNPLVIESDYPTTSRAYCTNPDCKIPITTKFQDPNSTEAIVPCYSIPTAEDLYASGPSSHLAQEVENFMEMPNALDLNEQLEDLKIVSNYWESGILTEEQFTKEFLDFLDPKQDELRYLEL